MRRMLVSLVCMIGLAACGGQAATPSEVVVTTAPTDAPTAVPSAAPTTTAAPQPTGTQPPTPQPTPLPETVGPESYPPAINPLTGLEVDDPGLLAERRPLLVKISNAPEVVRPQSGVSYADLMFEHYAEGGWTRFTALYWSQGVDRIGSVRSVRLVDLQLAPAFDGIVAFSGGSNGVIDTIRESDIYPYNVISPQFGYGEPYFRRVPREGLPFEHTMFTDTAQLWAWLGEQNVRTETRHSRPGWAFNPVPPAGGLPASSVLIDYARTDAEWRYDPLRGQYLRWTDDVAHTDALNGEQFAFENIIILSAYHEEIELFPEKYFGEERSWFIDLVGGGPVTLVRDGVAYEGQWVRQQPGDLITFYDPQGEPLILKPGRSFFQIISTLQGQYAQEPEQVILSP